MPCISQGLALYSYESQNEEELTMNEDEQLEIFEKDDEDWWLVKGTSGLLGFVPATYIEESGEAGDISPQDSGYNLNEEPEAEVEEEEVQPQHSKEISEQQAIDALTSLNALKDAMTPMAAPKNISYWGVQLIEKDSKKKQKGKFGVDNQSIYLVRSSDNKILNKWELVDLNVCKKKSKKITLEFNNGKIYTVGCHKSDLERMFNTIQLKKSSCRQPNAMPAPVETNVENNPPLTISPPPITQPSPVKMNNEQNEAESSIPQIAIALYDYEAQDEDELTISENDNLMVVDNSDPDWVKVRLISKTGGGEGMVPRTYIEIREPGQTQDNESHHEPPTPQTPIQFNPVIPSIPKQPEQRQINMDNVRTWIDKSGTFKVEAEYLGLNNGKVQLFKLNGKIIDVALDKLSTEDVQYVESITGQQLLPEEAPPPLPSRDNEAPPPLPQRDEAVPPPIPNRPVESVTPPPIPQRPSESDVPPVIPQRPASADIPPIIPQRPAMANEPPKLPKRPSVGSEGDRNGRTTPGSRRTSGDNPPQLPTRPMEATRPPKLKSAARDENRYI